MLWPTVNRRQPWSKKHGAQEQKRLAKETKSGEQLAAEAEKREELATVAAEKKEAIERAGRA